MEMQLTGSQIATQAAEFLTDSGLIDQSTLDEAYEVANCLRLPIGRVLVTAGHIADPDLTSALKAAKLFLTGKISRSHSLRTLRQSYVECLPFETILQRHPMNQSKLGELLLSAGVVLKDEIEKFSEQARESCLTLGRILVLTNTLFQNELANAIEVLVLVRDRVISFEMAGLALQLTWTGDMSLEKALFELTGTHPKAKSRLGELLVKANLLSEIDTINALEIALEHEKPLGRVLFETGLLPPLILKAALRLQALLDHGAVTEMQAAEILRQVHRLQMPVDNVLTELGELKRQAIDLLKRAGLITDADIAKALQLHPSYVSDVAGALLACQLLHIAMLKAAIRCLTLTQKRQITVVDSLNILRSCARSGITVDAALREMNEARTREFAVPHAFAMPLHAVPLTA